MGLLFVTGCSAVALAGYAYISQVRVGFTHLPLWVYLLALGATALIGGVATTLVADPLSDLPRAGERLGEHLIVVPVSEWDTLRATSTAPPPAAPVVEARKILPRTTVGTSAGESADWREDFPATEEELAALSKTATAPPVSAAVPPVGPSPLRSPTPPSRGAPDSRKPRDLSNLSETDPEDVNEIIRLLEAVAPVRPRPPERNPTVLKRGKTPEDALPCRHCQDPIPADRPWLRCESCGGSLCLDGLVEAAQAGHPGHCPTCRSLMDETLET